MNCILGVDPGVSGAIAFYWPAAPDRIIAEDIPVVAGRINAAGLYARIVQMQPDLAIIEDVSAMPGQGVSSTFKFGQALGTIEGILCVRIPTRYVRPAALRKYWKIPGGKEGKERARALAIRLFPACASHFSRKKDHNRADAALIALFGAEEASSYSEC